MRYDTTWDFVLGAFAILVIVAFIIWRMRRDTE